MNLYKTLHTKVIDNLKKAGIYEHYTHYLITKQIRDTSITIDLGANEGKFYTLLNNKYNCTSYVVEASPTLFKMLPIVKKTFPFHYAIGKNDGPITFFLSNNKEANSLHATIAAIGGDIKPTIVEGITFENFLKKANIPSRIEVLKIDIEGAELDVLENISANSLASISQIAVEFHDFIFNDDNYLNRLKSSWKKLQNNNFLVLKISEADWREALFINVKLNDLDLSQKIRLKMIHPLLHLTMSLYRIVGGKINFINKRNGR